MSAPFANGVRFAAVDVTLQRPTVAAAWKGRLARGLHGLWLPWRALGAVLRDPARRGRYLRITVTQALLSVVLGLSAFAAAAWWLQGKDVTIKASHQWIIDYGLVPLAAAIAAVHVVQSFVLWLTRDHHDVIERGALLAAGLVPSEPEARPRIRTHFRWLWKRLRRNFKAGVLVGSVGPIALPLAFAAAAVPMAWTVIATAWGLYWYVVYTAGRSSSAWNRQGELAWYLRAWRWMTDHVSGFRWAAPRGYGRWWERATKKIAEGPVACVEADPWAFSGLAASKMVCGWPVLRCFMKPLISAAAEQLVAELPPPATVPALDASVMPLEAAAAVDAAPAQAHRG